MAETAAPPTLDEVVPRETRGRSGTAAYWQAGTEKEMAVVVRTLARRLGLHEPPPEALTDTDRVNLIHETRKQFAAFRTRQLQGKTNRDTYNRICLLYRELAERVPDRGVEAELVKEYVEFLNQEEFRQLEPVLWYFHVNQLLDAVTAASKGHTVRSVVAESGHPVIRMRLRLGASLK